MRYEIATLTTSDRKGYFLKYVYAFMALGMIITALSAFLFSLITPLVNYLSKSVFAVVMIAIVEVVLVGLISGCIKKTNTFSSLAFIYIVFNSYWNYAFFYNCCLCSLYSTSFSFC